MLKSIVTYCLQIFARKKQSGTHQLSNNHSKVQFCPCFRQQVLLKRAHGGTSPSPPSSLIEAWVSDNSWPIIKLCRNKIFPNGAEAIILKGVGWRINQKTAARSITRSFIRWQDLTQIRFWRAGSESDLQIPHCSENAFYTTIVLAPTIWASISEGFCLVWRRAQRIQFNHGAPY